MEKSKLLALCVIALILLNLGLLAFMFNRPGRHHQRNREIIIERLHLDQNQIQQYDELIVWHQREIRKIEDNMRQTKNKLYLQLPDTPNENTKDSLINAIADDQKKIERTHFKHFADIRKLCRKEQLPAFDALTQELAQLFSRPQGPPPHER